MFNKGVVYSDSFAWIIDDLVGWLVGWDHAWKASSLVWLDSLSGVEQLGTEFWLASLGHNEEANVWWLLV